MSFLLYCSREATSPVATRNYPLPYYRMLVSHHFTYNINCCQFKVGCRHVLPTLANGFGENCGCAQTMSSVSRWVLFCYEITEVCLAYPQYRDYWSCLANIYFALSGSVRQARAHRARMKHSTGTALLLGC